MAKLQSPTEPPSDAEQIAVLQSRIAELELELQQVKDKLRQQVSETQLTPEKALSLLRTTLEITADGILAIDAQGYITHFNRQFVQLWQVPESIIGSSADWQLLPFMQEQLRNPEAFIAQVRAESAQPNLESHDFLELKDGRVFERFSKPQVLGEEIIGRVISCRDITTDKATESAVRHSKEHRNLDYDITRQRVETELRESQRLMQAVIDAAPMRIYLKDLQGRYLMYNRHCESVTGLRWEQVIGKTDWEVFPQEIASEFQETDRAALAAKNAVTCERVLQERDGIHTYFTTKFPVFDADGNPYGVCGISADITERKRMEEALRQSEERFSKAFRANPAATTITTLTEGRYIDVNDSFLVLSGFEREDVIGKTSVELGIWVADPSQVMPQLIQQLQQQPIHDLEVKFRNKSGEIRDGLTSAVLIDLSGELCILSQLYDVTDRKRAEAALQYRLDFEALLTHISTQFINLKATEINQGINQALQQIGEFTQVDRACIFLIANERFFNTHQWCAADIPSLVYPAEGLTLSEISWTVEQLRQFKTLCVPDVADLPEPRKSISQSFGVKSYLAVPIAYEGSLIGSLSFNSIRTTTTWSAEDMALLTALADIFANALIRQRSEEALRESEERFSKAFRANPAATAITTLAEGRYIDVNESFLNLLGFRREEVIGQTAVELGLWVNSTERPQKMQRLIEQLQQQPLRDLEIQFRNRSGEIREGLSSIDLIDLSGELCMLSQLCDVTDRKRTEAALKYRVDFEALLTSISTRFINLKAAEVDQEIHQALQQIGEFAQVDRIYLFLISEDNTKGFNTHQWSAEGIQPFIYPPEGVTLDNFSEVMEELRQLKTVHVPNTADLSESRSLVAESFGIKSYVVVPIAHEGSLIGSLSFNSVQAAKTWSAEDVALLGVLANIFANALIRKRSEEALHESEERFRQLAENIDATFWIFSINEQQQSYISPAYEKIWGRSVQSLYQGDFQDFLNTVHPDDHTQLLACIEQQNRGEAVEKVYRIIQPNGSLRWIRDRAFPVHDAQGRFYRVAGVAEDITERKLAEETLQESEQRFRQLAENIDTVFWMLSIDALKIIYVSPAYERIWKRSSLPLYESNQGWIDSIHPDDYDVAISLRERQIRGESTEVTYRIIQPEGEIHWIYDRSFPIYDSQGRLYRVAGIADDITARKLAEEQLEASLQEKEVLLKEVHHRVKNNLQVVSSLLDLQSLHIAELQVLEMFRESQNRVRSMALIHEKLYQSKSLSKVNFADYIQSLVVDLIQTYAINPDRITLQLNLEPVALNLDTAIPCGLLLNEVISNALKHAFPDNRDGTLWIYLCCLPQDVANQRSSLFELVVGNDGIKFTELPDFSSAKSLGFQLVNVLIQQLRGQIEVNQAQGTEFKLRFSELEP